VPDPLLDVAREAWLENDFNPLRRALVHPERIGKRVGRKIDGLEPFFRNRQRLDPFDSKRAELLVLRHVGHDVETALREDQSVGLDPVVLFAIAGKRVIPHHRAAVIECGVQQLRHARASRR